MYESDSNAFNHQVIRKVDFAIQSYGSIVTIDSHDQDMYDSKDQDIGHMDGRRYCSHNRRWIRIRGVAPPYTAEAGINRMRMRMVTTEVGSVFVFALSQPKLDPYFSYFVCLLPCSRLSFVCLLLLQ